MAKKDKFTCDNCGKEFDELVTREGFIMSYYIEWVCRSCFRELEGVDFKDYPGGRCEHEVQAEAGH